jgi:crotonobetainyl-CoA:carnitine CoA-transferase CaiB-like acyl-CoA transferase
VALPLAGLTVVSLEQAVAAPFATRQLADLGARVIKIERPGTGDFARSYDTTVKGQSSYFVWLNRSKESVTLDLSRPAAAGIMQKLIERADVFVQNLAPGAAGRLGVGAADLRARHPRLIACSISGYGTAGPFADKKAYDLLVQSEVGLLSITGTNDAPSRVGISVADIAAGMYAFSGVLTAVLARAQTGEGATLDVSLFDALGEWMGAPAYYTAYGGAAPARTGGAHATIAPYEAFGTRDGAEIYLGIQNAREWTRFCADVIGDPDLADDPRFKTNPARVQHRDALHAIVEQVVAGLDQAEVVARLDRAGIASARRNEISAFVQHEQLSARDRWAEIDSPGGPIRALRPPLLFEGLDPVMGAVPSLGQHTEAVLDELGFDRATIARFRHEGAI